MSTKLETQEPPVGRIVRDGHMLQIWTHRGWTWFPNEALELVVWARRYGWKAVVDVPDDGVLRQNADTDLILPILLGREAGPTSDGKDSLAYLFRVTWACDARGGKFKLVGHIYMTNVHGWTDIPSVSAVKKIVSTHPVVLAVPNPRKG